MNTSHKFLTRAAALVLLALCLGLVSGCRSLHVEIAEQSTLDATRDFSFQRGLNLGNALEAPNFRGRVGHGAGGVVL